MNLLLTTYDTFLWKEFVSATGLPIAEQASVIDSSTAIIEPIQSTTEISALLSDLSQEQALWLAIVQAEYFIANSIENGSSLIEAAFAWKQKTSAILDLHRQHRRKLNLFNLHQALSHPNQFRRLLIPNLIISDYIAHEFPSNLPLLASCQHISQHPELQKLNTHLQASVLPLCDDEKPMLDIENILLQNNIISNSICERDLTISHLQQALTQTESSLNHKAAQLDIANQESNLRRIELEEAIIEYSRLEQAHNEAQKELAKALIDQNQQKDKLVHLEDNLIKSQEEIIHLQLQLSELKNTYLEKQTQCANLESSINSITEERGHLLAQLQQVQEQFEQYYLATQKEHQNNKHALLAREKQQAKEVHKLESELRKTKAKAANAEFSGQLLQQELNKVRKSISWKAATPVRVLGRLIRKNDPARDKLMQEIGLLLTSEYFDVEWYLQSYPDVAESQINPAEHYLLHGAAEGRLPGPLFDGNWYLHLYPDVVAADINPLLHFILYGQQEGRSSSPILLTNDSQNPEEQVDE